MRAIFLSVLLTVGISVQAETAAFTVEEKACFDSLVSSNLTYFIQKKNDPNAYSMGSQLRYAAEYFKFNISVSEQEQMQTTHYTGIRIVDGKTIRICMRKLRDTTMVSCVKETELPLTTDIRNQIFVAAADYITVGPKSKIEKFNMPALEQVQEARKACENINKQLTQALDGLAQTHPSSQVSVANANQAQ